MPIIGYPIGDFDTHFIIDDIYKTQDFHSGWYFVPHDFPNYTFVSTDFDPNIEEVVQNGDMFRVEGFDPYIEKMNFPQGYNPTKKEYIKDIYFHYPSGVPYQYYVGNYWEMFGDLNNPYLFIPYFNPNTYGEIAWLDFNTPIERLNANLSFVEHLLAGIVFAFKEKVVEDKTFTLPLKEKIISFLSCDIEIVRVGVLKITWSGEKVPSVEILRKELSEKDFGNPIGVVPFDNKEFLIHLDNDSSYTYSVRGSNGTGMSNIEVTIGVSGATYIEADISLGDFVKIYEGDIDFVESYETEIYI